MIVATLLAANGKKTTLDELMLFDPSREAKEEARKRAQAVTLRKWLEGKANRKE